MSYRRRHRGGIAPDVSVVRNRTADPLTRHLLCSATQLHDRSPDGTCRDCSTPLTPDTAVCDDKRTIDLPRTPWGGIS